MNILLALAAGPLAVLALAAPAGAAGITYDCDTAAGHFSDLVLPAPAGAFTITGKVQVNRIVNDAKWAPTARLRVGSAEPGPGSAPDDYAGIELTALPGKAVSLKLDTVQAFSFDAKGRESEMIPASIGATGAAQPFRVRYDGQSVAVTIGSESRSYPLKASAPIVEIVCSTGEFLFTDLLISSGA